jgi:hypothetical protein
MRQKYDHIPCSAESIRKMWDCGIKKLPPAAARILEEPITLDELRHVVTAG